MDNFALLAGCKRNAHMEHSPQKHPRIQTENQRSYMTPEQSASSFSRNQFNSPPFQAGNYVATHLSGSLSPSTSGQWISPTPQQHPSPGPSRLPPQG